MSKDKPLSLSHKCPHKCDECSSALREAKAAAWKAAYECADSFEMQGADAFGIVRELKRKSAAALRQSKGD